MTYVEGFGPRLGNRLRGLLAATVSIAAFGLLGIASAAEGIDYNSSRSNKTSGIAAPGPGSEGSGQGKATPKLSEAAAKIDEIDAMVASISQQMAQLQSLCDELSSLSSEVDAELSSNSEEHAEMLEQLDTAQRLFSEQIASLLDESSVLVVTGDLEKKKKETQFQIESWSFGANNAGLAVSVSPMTEELASLQGVFQSFAAACHATGEHFKEVKLTVK